MRRALLVLLSVTPLLAHHSAKAMYDVDKVVTMQGVITETRWTNPHALVFLDVTDNSGKTVSWEVEMGAPNSLMREGLKKVDFEVGEHLTIGVWVAKDGSHHAAALTITLPDGRVLTSNPMWGPEKQ